MFGLKFKTPDLEMYLTHMTQTNGVPVLNCASPKYLTNLHYCVDVYRVRVIGSVSHDICTLHCDDFCVREGLFKIFSLVFIRLMCCAIWSGSKLHFPCDGIVPPAVYFLTQG